MPFNHHGTDLRFADVPPVMNGSFVGTRLVLVLFLLLMNPQIPHSLLIVPPKFT